MAIERTSIIGSNPPVSVLRGFQRKTIASWILIYGSASILIFSSILLFLNNFPFIRLFFSSIIAIVHILYVVQFYKFVSKFDDYVIGYSYSNFDEEINGWKGVFFAWEINVFIAIGFLFSISLTFYTVYTIWGNTLFVVNQDNNVSFLLWLAFILDQVGNLMFLGLFEAFNFKSSIMTPISPWGSAIVYSVRVVIITVIFLSVKRWYDTRTLIAMNIKLLKNTIESVEAQERLKKIGYKAIPALVKALSSEDENTRGFSAELLSYMGDKRAVKKLINLLKDKSSHVRANAVEALATCDDGTNFHLIRNLIDDEDSNVRKVVAIIMSVFKDEKNIGVLKKALDDKEQEVREAAVQSLSILLKEGLGTEKDFSVLSNYILQKNGIEQLEALSDFSTIFPQLALPLIEKIRDETNEDEVLLCSTELLLNIRKEEYSEDLDEDEIKIHNDKDVEILISLLDSHSEDTRSGAATLLEDLKDEKSIPFLTKSLSDPDPFVRSAAISALAELNAPHIAEKIIVLLSDKEEMVREEVASAIEELGATEYTNKILEAYKNETDTSPRQSLFDCLCEFYSNEVKEVIIKGILDKDPDIRQSAIRHFTNYSEPEAIPSLLQILDEESDEFQLHYTIKALAKSGDDTLIPVLKKFLNHDSKWVRREVEYGIQILSVDGEEIEINEDEIHEKLMKYPFFKAWKDGKLSKKLFEENMNAFKEQFYSDENISYEEYKWILQKELEKTK